MIIKKREIPLHIKKLQALLRRTPPNHPKIPAIKETLAKRLAGYRGENSIDYPLSFLPEHRYFIIHDLRLLHNIYYFQIDSLVISQNFILLLEVKNIAGTLFFDPSFNQLIRTLDEKEDRFPDPLIQTQRQEFQLREWLQTHKFPDIPLISFVVISHPQAIIRTTPENKKIAQKVSHLDALPGKLQHLNNSYQDEKYSEKEIKKLIRLILKQHTPREAAILEQFQLTKKELLSGVQCPNCTYLPMKRIHGNWFCPTCLIKTKNAHFDALTDYSLLFSTTITNSEAMDFLQVASPFVCNRLLHSTSFSYTGSKKGRTYFLIEG
ncbi:nuclease-related domain-containing protein [Halalkalibacter lacteus]|uniref:nuclease-related domain-containing protein n=1 Tax=Halalkalibacter lacteus TaxID=3090663 RepID=UPI002FC66922